MNDEHVRDDEGDGSFLSGDDSSIDGQGPVVEPLIVDNRYDAIDRTLERVVSDCSSLPEWHDAWVRSRRGLVTSAFDPDEMASPEERLAVWKRVRDSGLLPEGAGLYLLAAHVGYLTEIRVAELMDQIDDEVDDIWERHGLGEWRAEADRDCARLPRTP